MVKILISGSRDTSPKLLERAHFITVKAWYRGYEILVGDAPGIDMQVVKTAEKFNANYTAYGITAKARNNALCYVNVSSRFDKKYNAHAAYYHRDRLMVAEADMIFCVWNEESMGTYRVFEFAIQSGKRAYLYNGNKMLEQFDPEGVNGKTN